MASVQNTKYAQVVTPAEHEVTTLLAEGQLRGCLNSWSYNSRSCSFVRLQTWSQHSKALTVKQLVYQASQLSNVCYYKHALVFNKEIHEPKQERKINFVLGQQKVLDSSFERCFSKFQMWFYVWCFFFFSIVLSSKFYNLFK